MNVKRITTVSITLLTLLTFDPTPVNALPLSPKGEMAEKLFNHLKDLYNSRTTKTLIDRKSTEPNLTKLDSTQVHQIKTDLLNSSKFKWILILGILVVLLLIHVIFQQINMYYQQKI